MRDQRLEGEKILIPRNLAKQGPQGPQVLQQNLYGYEKIIERIFYSSSTAAI